VLAYLYGKEYKDNIIKFLIYLLIIFILACEKNRVISDLPNPLKRLTYWVDLTHKWSKPC